MRNDLNFRPIYIEATSIEDSWKQFIYNCLNFGSEYIIELGSRAGQYRKTLDTAIGYIRYPETRPLSPLAKEGQVLPTNEEDVEKYFNEYIYNPVPPTPNEHYKYSEFLFPLSNAVVEYYSTKGFGTAHATMRVGDPLCFLDYFKPHKDETSRKTTPCLLFVDTAIKPGKINGQNFLIFHIGYRSWDLLSGYPVNVAGIQLLKEFMAAQISDNTGKLVLPWPTTVFCKDLHIYESDIPAAMTWV